MSPPGRGFGGKRLVSRRPNYVRDATAAFTSLAARKEWSFEYNKALVDSRTSAKYDKRILFTIFTVLPVYGRSCFIPLLGGTSRRISTDARPVVMCTKAGFRICFCCFCSVLCLPGNTVFSTPVGTLWTLFHVRDPFRVSIRHVFGNGRGAIDVPRKKKKKSERTVRNAEQRDHFSVRIKPEKCLLYYLRLNELKSSRHKISTVTCGFRQKKPYDRQTRVYSYYRVCVGTAEQVHIMLRVRSFGVLHNSTLFAPDSIETL